ncbi:VWA domain-containing protein [Salisaeta longa]|uniref:VWA domain-containing protein n=1 Tax=Salisaeta longa TaxID=503170 RepID=UPI00146CF04D|nr:VWA domain-containing protein [Salisaeta longa]
MAVAAGMLGWALWRRHRAEEAFGQRALLRRLSTAWRGGRVLTAALLLGTLACWTVALMGPRVGTATRTVERKGLDLVIALDVSSSMYVQDVPPHRLALAKESIRGLLNDLSGDRVGLVVFAGDGFVQCPLTTDYNALRLFLDVADPSLMPTPGTNMRAMQQAVLQAFDTQAPPDSASAPGRAKVLLVVGDGEYHQGNASSAAEALQDAGIQVYAAGVGTRAGGKVPAYENERRVGFKRTSSGQVALSRLQPEPLRTLAQSGAYLRLSAAQNPLRALPDALARLQRTTLGTEQFTSYRELFQWPLALGLALLLVALALPERKGPSRTPQDAPPDR